MLGLVELQQERYTDVERLLKELESPAASAPDTWWRFFRQSVLGAALSAEKKYDDAERLLLEGYSGLAERAALIPADSSVALDRAGQWIVQLYQNVGKAGPRPGVDQPARRRREVTAKAGTSVGQASRLPAKGRRSLLVTGQQKGMRSHSQIAVSREGRAILCASEDSPQRR